MRWVDRSFSFDAPVELYPNLISRLRGAPLRAAALGQGAEPERLTRRPAERWSAQENVGHLADLDGLWLLRLDDFLAGRAELTPWDVTNQATTDAGYNARPYSTVASAFADVRNYYVERLQQLAPADFARTALHPRLKVPMRLVDAMYFAAEHDDHHLAIAEGLVRLSDADAG
jgi:uncharacterized damage-inducible protein DinB